MSSQPPEQIVNECAEQQATSVFSIRQLLRDRKALLVHFNTPQSSHPTGFPDDLLNARTLRGEELSFSTIVATDRGPNQVNHPDDANAGGSVGIVVDIKDEGSVVSVLGDDSGSNKIGSFGKLPSEDACTESIDWRNGGKPGGNNEWRIKDYTSLGIFIFPRPQVFKPNNGDTPITLSEVLTTFPDDPIYSAFNGSFQRYDRETGTWTPITYDGIVPL